MSGRSEGTRPTPEEILATWRESAPHWEKNGALLRQLFAPITRAMTQVAGISSGAQVLDVAGGVGDPTIAIAASVGPRGSVVCTDVVEEMVAAARKTCAERALTNVSFRRCSADELPFEDARFDHVVCRLGAMFFPDTGAALREMLRVTKPRGRLTFAVWTEPASNPMFTLVTDLLARYLPPPPPEPPDTPGPFRFAEPGRLASLLREAGAVDVSELPLRFTMEAPISFDEFWDVRKEISESLRTKLRELSAERVNAFAADLRRAAAPYFDGKRMRLPGVVLVVTATASGS
jgi:SAM-dependent methyltransferase